MLSGLQSRCREPTGWWIPYMLDDHGPRDAPSRVNRAEWPLHPDAAIQTERYKVLVKLAGHAP
jgi:hypothetical protein